MAFRGLLRPGQGFRAFCILRRVGTTTANGRPYTEELDQVGRFYGIISRVSPQIKEQWKQAGTPVTHTVLQRGTKPKAKAGDILELAGDGRQFMVTTEPENPGELGHFLIYTVEERMDLWEAKNEKL